MHGVIQFADHQTTETDLFELGCFTVSVIDLWLFLNKAELKSVVSDTLLCRFNELYERIFVMKFEEIGAVLEQRCAVYGDIFRDEGLDGQKLFKEAANAMIYSHNKTKPCLYPYEQAPPPDLDSSQEFMFFQLGIMNWMKHIYKPVTLKVIEDVCDGLR